MSQNRPEEPKRKVEKNRNLSAQYHELKPTIWVGKSGITATLIDEICGQTKARGIVKVKWLASTEVDPKQVASESKTVLLLVRGRTMVLADQQYSKRQNSRNI